MNLDLSQVDCVSSEGERRQKRAFEKLKSTSNLAPGRGSCRKLKNPVDLS